MTSKKPILITGSHRSGSTWVGKMLGESPDLVYINEPFHPYHHSFFHREVFQHWFTYVTPENEAQYQSYLNQSIYSIFDFIFDARTVKTRKDKTKFIQNYWTSLKKRLRGARPLVKDPIALFSAEWLAATFEMDVVVLIRHPAAFAYSLKRAGWGHDFSHFWAQPLLMRDYLYPFEADIQAAIAHPKDIIDQAALLWNLIHYQIKLYQQKYDHWLFMRHEDLSRHPVAEFQMLFQQLGVDFSPDIQTIVETYSRSEDKSAQTLGFSKRDSRANIFAWKTGLSTAEIDRIRHQVEAIASAFYTDQDW